MNISGMKLQPHSGKHSDVNLIRWDLSDKKSIIQLIMLAGF